MSNYKILIINLQKDVNRKSALSKQILKYDIKNTIFLSAIDGATINEKLVELPKEISRAHLGEKYEKHLSVNEIGCRRSHSKALEFAKTQNLDFVIILEDDVVLCEDWNDRLTKLFQLVPKNWQHIYLSGQPNEEEQRKSFQPLNLAPFLHIEKSINTMGAFSYILRKESFDKIINEIDSKSNLPVDDIINNLIISNKLPSYTFYPFMTYYENEITLSIWNNDIWEQEYSKDHESKRFYVKKL